MEIFNKLTQYNLFNYLLPGVILCALIKNIWGVDLAGSDLLIAAFIYYFVGMCASRVGSILIEPVLKKIKFVVFSDYTDFLKAEEEDEKIQELLTTANFYRSVLGCLFSFLILSFGFWLVSENKISSQTMLIGVVGLVVILVLQGYRKQVSYIKKRVDYRKNDNANS